MGKDTSEEPRHDPPGSGRRQGDRRQVQAGFDGPDRRKGERRSGADRRATPRDDGQGNSEG